MGSRRYKLADLLEDEELMQLVKEYKYATTGGDRLAVSIFASPRVRERYKALSYGEIERLESYV